MAPDDDNDVAAEPFEHRTTVEVPVGLLYALAGCCCGGACCPPSRGWAAGRCC